ncbi:putative alanine racemase [Cocos nucifera]|uniref:RING-type E3 ubiquitin transferase n=1 Tax=Cocos nucifera TaxID=13894 RepID=A0A8K0NCR6_COCNU|nr:putative alanine racemase [Cocos nucifera]
MATLSPSPAPPPKNSRAIVRVPSIPRPWILLFLAALFPSSAVSVAAADISYADHCGSIVPESDPEDFLVDFPGALRLSNGFFTGRHQMFGDDRDAPFHVAGSFHFYAKSLDPARFPAVLRVHGTLMIRGRWYHVTRRNLTEGRSLLHRVRPRFPRTLGLNDRASIDLHGFWSEDVGKLCMVGAGHGRLGEGKLLSITAIFKLNYPKISNISSSLVSGTLESLDADNSSNHFDPISVIAYAQNKYEFTQISPAQKSCSRVNDLEESLGLDSGSICLNLQRYLRWPFEMEYGGQCSSGRCVPLTKSSGFSAKFVSLNLIHCLDDGKLHMYVEFSNDTRLGLRRLLVPEKTLVAEGVWDQKKNRLCLVACRIVSSSHSLAVNISVDDCTIRMSFWFPAVWSIENRNTIAGRMWSDQNENASGYFDTIFFRNSENDWSTLSVPGVKYNYTKIDAASKSCGKSSLWNLSKKKYPVLKYFEDFRFRISVRNAEGKRTRGFATPISIGETFHDAGNPKLLPAVKETNHSLQNVSYKINFMFSDSSSYMSMPPGISAEGVYDAQTGSLCMVGCRYIDSSVAGKQEKIGVSVDCGIRISIQLAPLNPEDGDHLSGTIRSTRDKSDPLFFEPLEIMPMGMDRNQAMESIWRRKIEITMVLISLTLSCIFLGLQLLHVAKNPQVLPAISMAMLIILTLGYMFPLVLNFEALFMSRNRQNVLSWRGGWLEVNEVIVRVMTMVAFLLQLRFLQVAWTARSADEGRRDLWLAEREALKIYLPLYLAGGLIAWFIRVNSNHTSHRQPLLTAANHHSFWENLVSYAGLILDGFLLPQVIFNIFSSSKHKALAPSFYVGTTAIRALPHVYDAYRASHYVPLLNSSYIYASPSEDFYSLAWDIIIPCTGVLFSGLIYLQQRFGGTFFLAWKKWSGGYETVPAVTS